MRNPCKPYMFSTLNLILILFLNVFHHYIRSLYVLDNAIGLIRDVANIGTHPMF